MMQWALARSNRNSMKHADGGACMTSSKPVAPNSCNISSKDKEVATITLNGSHRYIFVTFVALPLNEHCKIVAPFLLPVRGSDPINHLTPEAPRKMDGLEAVPSTILFQVDLQRSHLVNHAFSSKPFGPNCSSRSSFIGQVRNRVAAKLQNKVTKRSVDRWKKIADPSNVSSGLSDTYSSSTSDSTNQVKDTAKAEKHGRSLRKKPKRKGKRNKKSSEVTSSVSIEEEGVQEVIPCAAGDADCAGSNCLMVELPSTKEHISKDDLVNKEEGPKLLPFETCSATSKVSSLEESSITEEPCASIAKVVAVEALAESNTRKKDSGNSATSSSGSVQSTNQDVLVVKTAERKTSHGDVSVGSITDGHDAFISDPSFDGWNSEGSLSGNNDENNRLARKEEHEISPSDSEVVSDGSNCSTSFHSVPFGMGNLSHEKSCDLGQDMPENLHGAPGDCSNISADNADRIKCSSGNCSSTNDRGFIPNRTSRRANRLVQSSSRIASKSSGYTNSHARTGKENNHSVWQKVLRSSGNEGVPKSVNYVQLTQDVPCESTSSCIRYDLGQRRSKQERSGQCTSLYEISSQESSEKAVSHTDDSESSLLKEDHVSKNKNSEKLNARSNAGSKVEYTYQPRKSLPRSGLVRASKKKPLHAGAAEIPQQYVHQRSSSSATAYSQYVPCLKTDIGKAEVIDSYNSFIPQDSQPDAAAEFTLGKTTHSTEQASEPEVKLNNETKFTQGLLQSGDLDPFGQIFETRSSLQLYHDNRPDIKMEETNVYQEQEVFSQSYDYFSSTPAGWGNFVTGDSNVAFSDNLEQPDKSNNHAPSICKVNDVSILAKSNSYIGLSPDGQERSVSEGSLNEMVEAVHDAYTVQLKSEGHQLATGSHLAEFERVLYAATPMLSTSHSCIDGVSLWNEQLPRDFVYKHQICDNHTLRTLWQWYEEPGCYGLKVKVEDFRSCRRQGANLTESCAYLLPLLSAVQLFGHSRGSSFSGSQISSTEPTEESASLTNFWHVPILSMLLPKQFKAAAADNDVMLPRIPECMNKSSASNCCEGRNISDEKELCPTSLDGSELLFEYFESERPQQRKPLFEKIKELVEGEASPTSHMYGDPSYLVNLSLCDLHPASWFAVAWYPIYRIPEDSFRTAFLTYHSLGHFIHRSSSLDCSSEMKFVSPVVGLQRYNDQGECWFSLKPPVAISQGQSQTCEPSLILEKRLATLEKAASLMSRASVCKGGEVTMNRHPDYEFFLSRRW
ncbi:unnamed protein product [Victoria cruziana]